MSRCWLGCLYRWAAELRQRRYIKVVIDGGALVDWLRNQNYAVAMLQAAPNRIDGLAAGRPDAIQAIALDRASRPPPPGPDIPALGYGLSYGVNCRESYPFATPEDLAAAGRKAFSDYPASTRVGAWGHARGEGLSAHSTRCSARCSRIRKARVRMRARLDMPPHDEMRLFGDYF